MQLVIRLALLDLCFQRCKANGKEAEKEEDVEKDLVVEVEA